MRTHIVLRTLGGLLCVVGAGLLFAACAEKDTSETAKVALQSLADSGRIPADVWTLGLR